MARTLSLADDETGTTVSVRIEGDKRVTRLIVEGDNVTPQSLLMLAEIGFPLPRPAADEGELPAVTQPETAAKKPAPKQARKLASFTGPRPTDEELQLIYARHKGVYAAMAREVGCSAMSTATWVKAARGRGVLFDPPVEEAKPL